MDAKEAFAVLDLPFGASRDEIDRAYKDLVKVWHPDRFGHNPDLQQKAQEKLKRINEAYSFLKGMRDGAANHSSRHHAEAAHETIYRDADCRYIGGDIRFRGPSPLEFFGRPAAADISPAGLTLLTLANGQPDQASYYPSSSIILAWSGGKAWKQRDVSPTPHLWPAVDFQVRNDEVTVSAKDPEGIVKSAFDVRLRFQNAYFAELFAERLCSVFGLERIERPRPQPYRPPSPPEAPRPQPPPKPKPSPPNSAPAATAAKTANMPASTAPEAVTVAAWVAGLFVFILCVVVTLNESAHSHKSDSGDTADAENSSPVEQSDEVPAPAPQLAVPTEAEIATNHRRLGVLAFGQGDYMRAVEQFTEAIVREPSETNYLNRAKALLAGGWFAEATDDCTRAISVNPRSADAYFLRSLAVKNLGDSAGSLADSRRAFQADSRVIRKFEPYSRAGLEPVE